MGVGEQAKFWRDPAVHGLELLHARYVTHTFAPHMHEGYALGVIEQGAEQFWYRHANHIVPQGSIFVVNPGEIHTGSAVEKEGWKYRVLYPDATILQEAARQIVGKPHDVPFFPDPVVYDPELARQIADLHRAFEEPVSALERESRLLWTFSQLVLRFADDHPQQKALPNDQGRVQQIRAYLEENYAENISLKELAQQFHVSPFYLLHSFRRHTGVPPHAYQAQVRVQRARDLLRLGIPIATTAQQVGFADQSHLTRHFKRIVGIPPGRYRG
ncbi:AraC family transcriptional regulator [Dictyobacter alpinus]|uniref:AraC family transcriptional regulator n=1 Tax=Dictyobacter alpinus TaxID=2014873 RepID=A0A402BKM1_9CHLR|nr:AraC family transcriptional regulator [Dictyobacter alpinus]GCE31882.1 AraC family transcriptional regulator [Dictyobacter alpinus]